MNMKSFRLIAAAVAALLVPVTAADADMVVLKNGTRMTGEITGLKDGSLSLKTDYAGSITISADKIAGVTTDTLVTVRFAAGGYQSGRLTALQDGTIRLSAAKGDGSTTVSFADISELQPGLEIKRGLPWKGHINLGASMQSGNTDSEMVRADASVVARLEKDRIRLAADFTRENNAETRVEDNYSIALQHDRFVSEKVFFYTSGKLEHDGIVDLNLRTTLSTGLGYQFLETDRTNFSVEAGPAYILEDFENSPNTKSAAGRWAVNFDHYLWNRMAQFFHNHDGLFNLEETGDILVDSSTGLRLFVVNGFNVTAQLDLDWDNQPEPGFTSLDKKYLLTVGYKW